MMNNPAPSLPHGVVSAHFYLTPLPKPQSKQIRESKCRKQLEGYLEAITRRFFRRHEYECLDGVDMTEVEAGFTDEQLKVYREETAAARAAAEARLAREPEETRPYRSMAEVCYDVDNVVNYIWETAPPALASPFLLRITDEVITYARSFPAEPKVTFQLLRKLDVCLCSMIRGKSIETGEPLSGNIFTVTDMVRLRSILERTRNELMPLFYGDGYSDDDDDWDSDDPDGCRALTLAATTVTAASTTADRTPPVSTDGDIDMLDVADGDYVSVSGSYGRPDTTDRLPTPATTSEEGFDSDEPLSDDDILAGAEPRPEPINELSSVRPADSVCNDGGADGELQNRLSSGVEPVVMWEAGNIYQLTLVELGTKLGTSLL